MRKQLQVVVIAAIAGIVCYFTYSGIEGQRQVRSREIVRKCILSNLRQLAGAAEHYFIEHHATEVDGAALIGPGKFVRAMQSFDGENYLSLRIQKDGAIKFTTRSGIPIEYYLITGTSSPPK